MSSKKERVGWYFYDWANSAFYTSVITVFLGPYLTSIAKNASDPSGYLNIIGFKLYHGSYFPMIIAISVILQVLVLPLVGALTDSTNKKKFLLGLFAYLGSAGTMALYFLDGRMYILGGLLFIFANLAFGASIVVYNSFLNDIAPIEKRDKISSIGWAIGYLGGGISLALNLLLFLNAEKLGISTSFAVRISLCSSGLWWALFTIIPLFTLRNGDQSSTRQFTNSESLGGYKQFFKTLREARQYPQTILFLAAYLLYNEGVQTVIVISSQFGQEALGMSMSSLTTVILIVQFVAFFGSLLFGWMGNKIGNKRSILISLIIWGLCLLYAFTLLTDGNQFFILAGIIAIVLGGTQALSRSLYSLLIPKGKEAEYFSVYEITDKGTSWLGPALFALTLQLTESYRFAIFSLIIFLILGFLLLLKLNMKQAIANVEN
jgi:MFS transporter, UMF1 family